MKKKRLWAFLLTALLVGSAVNTAAFAQDSEKPEDNEISIDAVTDSIEEVKQISGGVEKMVGISTDITPEETGVPIYDGSIVSVENDTVGAATAVTDWKKVSNSYVEDEISSNPLYSSLYTAICKACDDFLYSTEDVAETYGYNFAYAEADDAMTQQEISKVYQCVVNNNPKYYWFAKTYYTDRYGIYLTTDYPNYSDRVTYDKAITDFMDGWGKQVDLSESDYEIELAAHDYLLNKIDYAYASDGSTPKSDRIVHSILSPALNNEAVCDGYSKTYSLMLGMAGIDSVMLTGGNHAWNAVKTGSKWYLTDTTWDDMGSLYDGIVYGNFNMPSDEFYITHTLSSTDNYIQPAIAADFDNTYYKKFGGFVSSQDYTNMLNGNYDGMLSTISAAAKNYISGQTNYIKLYFEGIPDTIYANRTTVYSCINNANQFSDNALNMRTSGFMYSEGSYNFKCNNTNTCPLTKDITLYKNGVQTGTYYTVAGALAAVSDTSSKYTIELKARNDSFDYGINAYPVSSQYKVFPKADITIKGNTYNGKNAQLQFMSDVSMPANISFVNADVTSFGTLSSALSFSGTSMSCTSSKFLSPVKATAGTVTVSNSTVEFDSTVNIKNLSANSSTVNFVNQTTSSLKNYTVTNAQLTASTLAFTGGNQKLNSTNITADTLGYTASGLGGTLPVIITTALSADKITVKVSYSNTAEKNYAFADNGLFLTTSGSTYPAAQVTLVNAGVTAAGGYTRSNGCYCISESITAPIEYDIADADISNISAQTYIGNEITPLIYVRYKGARILPVRDFTVSYKNNIEVGTAEMTLTGCGKYSGTVTKTFTIKERTSAKLVKPLIISRHKTPYTAVIIWRPDFTANGFEVIYSYDNSFSDAKTATVTGYGVNLLAISNLKADPANGYDSSKTIYAKIRSFYYNWQGEKVYSDYSDTRYVKA